MTHVYPLHCILRSRHLNSIRALTQVQGKGVFDNPLVWEGREGF